MFCFTIYPWFTRLCSLVGSLCVATCLWLCVWPHLLGGVAFWTSRVCLPIPEQLLILAGTNNLISRVAGAMDTKERTVGSARRVQKITKPELTAQMHVWKMAPALLQSQSTIRMSDVRRSVCHILHMFIQTWWLSTNMGLRRHT